MISLLARNELKWLTHVVLVVPVLDVVVVVSFVVVAVERSLITVTVTVTTMILFLVVPILFIIIIIIILSSSAFRFLSSSLLLLLLLSSSSSSSSRLLQWWRSHHAVSERLTPWFILVHFHLPNLFLVAAESHHPHHHNYHLFFFLVVVQMYGQWSIWLLWSSSRHVTPFCVLPLCVFFFFCCCCCCWYDWLCWCWCLLLLLPFWNGSAILQLTRLVSINQQAINAINQSFLACVLLTTRTSTKLNSHYAWFVACLSDWLHLPLFVVDVLVVQILVPVFSVSCRDPIDPCWYKVINVVVDDTTAHCHCPIGATYAAGVAPNPN